jgi:L-asparaginase II
VTAPLGVDGIVELAVLERSGLIESRHLGAAVVVDPSGAVLRELGDGTALVYGRSTLKLLQATAVLRSGVRLEGEQLVLASASHGGTPRHVAVVEQILARAGLGEEALQCPLDWPLDAAARRAASEPRLVTMNCSGKHASFLLACVENSWPTESYLDPAHPLQRLIRSTIEEYTGEPVAHVGVDGCGAPVFAVSLRGLARAVARVATGEESAPLVAAIRANSWALDTAAVATAIDELDVIAKTGAEGVFVAAAPDGTAVALKIIDGSTRAALAVGLTLLGDSIDADAAARVIAQTTERVLGGGSPVGELRPVV